METKRQRVKAIAPTAHVPADHKHQPDGKRGAGRPMGALGRLSKAARELAASTGELPHEFLLRVARGEVISTDVMDPTSGELKKIYQVPELPMRIDAAKAAAPYFAPKLSAIEVLAGASDDQLNQIIGQYAAQAGVGVGANGEGQASAVDNADSGPTADSWV